MVREVAEHRLGDHDVPGLSLTTCPPTTNFQFVNRCSSLVSARASRASATALIQRRYQFLAFASIRRGLNLAAAGDARSSSSCLTIETIHAGMVAHKEARYPSGIDFGCGFQSLCPSGTRCRARRVLAAFAFQLCEKKFGQLHIDSLQ